MSHRTSAAVRRLRPIATKAINVTIPTAKVPKRPGLILHRTATPPHPDDVTTYNGLRVSAIPKMLIELAPCETRAELDRLITASARRGLLHLDRVEAALHRHARRPGVAILRDALAGYRYTPPDKSGYERDFAAWVAADPRIPPPTARNVYIGPWEIDVWWGAQRLAVELDSRDYHSALRDFERDRTKDIWLQRHGIRPIGITAIRFNHDRAGIRDDLLALLALDQAA